MEMIMEKSVDKESVKCSEKEWEERCVALELEIGRSKSEYKLLDIKFKELEVEFFAVEDELKVLKRKNNELEEKIVRIENESKIGCGRETSEEGVVDLTVEEEDKVIQLMIENKVLECEKRRVEDNAEFWKEKVRELESQVVRLEKGGYASPGVNVGSLEHIKTYKRRAANKPKSLDNVLSKERAVDLEESFRVSPSERFSQIPGTPSIGTHDKHPGHTKEENLARKRLAFSDEGTPSKKMGPSTPVGGAVGNEKGIHSENRLSRTLADQSDVDDSSGYKGNLPSNTTPKRKRVSNVVIDSETDDDDKVPIANLKRKHLQEPIHDPAVSPLNSGSAGANNFTGSLTSRRRRLVPLRHCEEGSGVGKNSSSNIETRTTKYETGIPTIGDVEDDETEESESDSEDDNSDAFIDDRSSVSVMSSGNDESDSVGDFNESEIDSEDNMDFGEILSTIRRTRDNKLNWELEGDMLAAFGKIAELCLKAVCALYRQQTSNEQLVKGTIDRNKRGFSQCDAPRGTALAEFLLDGDPQSDLKKSVEELEVYDPYAVEECRTLATHYSKQLFEIYKNKEDPFFCPS